MPIVAVIGRKGGVGKTTVSVHLAGELAARGRSVMLIDADPQGSAHQWAAPGRLPIPVQHFPVTSDNLAEWVQRLRRIETDVLVLDCPPHLDVALGTAVGMADLVLLPCGPSGLDILAMNEVLGVTKAARQKRGNGRPRALVVPNKLDRRTAEGRELVEELGKLGEPVSPPLAYRSAFVRAFNTGDTVGVFAPGTLADQEVKALASTVTNIMEAA